jgi:hypothetical protein
MPKRSSKSTDRNQIAANVVAKSAKKALPVVKPVKNPAAVALGHLGGLKGGKARAAKLSPEKRKEIATKAANVRWDRFLKQMGFPRYE